ncbi:MAG TPA: DUF3482 domain-containing protein [Planctomycetota bacterium]|nr:DUF3482 domain-containing protein [Planctomycetota bacterium]
MNGGEPPIPTFVVVGNVNQGKSSIVAALAEDATVPIDPMPGTTQRAGEYAFRAGGETVFRVIDTPGFQRARQALAWMQQRAATVADRPRAVAEFVRAHAHDETFVDEVRLLAPIVEGASHIYVVDASAHFEPSSEAEMEILRWTGQPGMAVLNRTRDRDYSAEWRPVLAQFFHVVREFNAHRATFADRLELLHAFRAVRQEWHAAMDRAIATMQRAQEQRITQAAAAIAEHIAGALTHVERRELRAGDDRDAVRRELEAAFADALRERERRARAEVERIFGHRGVERQEEHLPLLDADLLSDESFRAFGLTRTQLAKQGMLWGGAAGLALDLMVGGFSGFAGMAIGAGVGAVAGFVGTTQLTRLWGESSKLSQVLFPGVAGRFLALGPVTNPGFAWVLLDRALVHCRLVRDRSHARKDALDLRGEKAGIAATLPAAVRGELDSALRGLLTAALKNAPIDAARDRLARSVRAVVAS